LIIGQGLLIVDQMAQGRGGERGLAQTCEPERELFTQLLTVSGIGPKVALAVVSGSPAAELRRANEILKTASAFFAAAELDRHTR